MPLESWSNNKEEKFENIVNKILNKGKNGILNNKNIDGETIKYNLLTELMERKNINDLIKSAKNKSGHESNLTSEQIKKILISYLKSKKKEPNVIKKKVQSNKKPESKSTKKTVTFRNKKGPNGNYEKLTNVKTFNVKAEIEKLENNASRKITKAVRKTAEKSKETKKKAEKLKKTEKKNTDKVLKKINEVKNYLKELRAQITDSYRKKSPQFVFLNLDKVKNESLSRKKLTQLLKSGTIIKYLKLICNGNPFFNVSNEDWYLCITGYIEKESNEISHQLGLVAYKKDIVSNFSGFRNRTDKLKFKTKIFLDLGKENKLTNTKDLTEKIKKYLNSKVKNNNNYTQNEEGFYVGNVLIKNNGNNNMNVK